ncbi:restriction endonuclease subunit S [Marinospirillum insulare]|uniref:Restriction endonuclease subunit S n=1 Tax=Marinospirillum insulare TaxID=217169 RepID=A0ABQ6A172_9GAMM|nr:restriction endonuclease subunit S [Marinospirillum insulare]GLR63869.1 restriction endonuclease subunit S [Marinospirillum insulare]
MTKDAVAEVSQQYLVEAAEKRVPEGYKQTEVGVTNSSGANLNATCGGPQGGGMDSRRIPEGWKVVLLDDCTVKVGSGKTPTGGSSVYVDTGRPFIRSQNVERGNLDLSDVAYITDDMHSTFLSSELKENDVLLNITGASIGRCAKANKLISGGNVNQHVCIIRTVEKKLAPSLLVELINSRLGQEQIDSYQAGGNREGLNFKQVRQLEFPVATSIKEQTAIANALSDTDALLSELEKLIAKKQAIKTATMQQLLTGRTRLPQFAQRPDGSKKGYKQSELGEIPEDWEAMQLGAVAVFLKGAGLPKSDLVDSGKKQCIHYGQLFTTYGPKIEKIFSSTNIEGSVKSEVNDILMPTSDVTPNGLATASCILESGIILGGDILVIRSNKELLNGVFFAYLIIVMRDQIMQLVTGSTVYHLYGSDMAKFLFANPTLEEQTAIATILSDMDEEIQALEQRLNKTRQIKQGMMQQLLTGKIRLLQPAQGVSNAN